MRFEWHDWEDANKLRKHGIAFETPLLAFETPLLAFETPMQLPVQDRDVDGQRRWQTIGPAGDVLLLLVASFPQCPPSNLGV